MQKEIKFKFVVGYTVFQRNLCTTFPSIYIYSDYFSNIVAIHHFERDDKVDRKIKCKNLFACNFGSLQFYILLSLVYI